MMSCPQCESKARWQLLSRKGGKRKSKMGIGKIVLDEP
jgi:hypothetical protein